MTEPQSADADASPSIPKSNAEASLSTPLSSLAAGLMNLDDPSDEAAREQVLKALKERIGRVERDDTRGMESMLAYQAQVLHVIFAHAVDKYAACREDEKRAAYGRLALKTQNLCRMTACTINYIKQARDYKRKHMLAAGEHFFRDKMSPEDLMAMHSMAQNLKKDDPQSFEDWAQAIEKTLEDARNSQNELLSGWGV